MAPEPAPISFARGAPSLDIVDVEGLRASADRALRFAQEVQAALGPGADLPLRAGVHFGEVIAGDTTLHGAGIIIAVRLQGLARRGGVTFSAAQTRSPSFSRSSSSTIIIILPLRISSTASSIVAKGIFCKFQI